MKGNEQSGLDMGDHVRILSQMPPTENDKVKKDVLRDAGVTHGYVGSRGGRSDVATLTVGPLRVSAARP